MIEHCNNYDYGCDNRVEESGDTCADCKAEREREQARYAWMGRVPRYTRAEIEDCYSEPSERAKRNSLLEGL